MVVGENTGVPVYKEINQIHSKRRSISVFFGRMMLAGCFDPHYESDSLEKTHDAGRIEGRRRGTTEVRMAGWLTVMVAHLDDSENWVMDRGELVC